MILLPLDHSAAFDRVDHQILLHRLSYLFGIVTKMYINVNGAVCKVGVNHLRNVSWIRKYISCHTMEMLVHAFITFRLDFCNSLLYGLPKQTIKRLQHVHVAARIVALTPKHSHISPVLQKLHWLPIEEHITFKILLMTFKCLNGLAPSYLYDLVTWHIARCNLLDLLIAIVCLMSNIICAAMVFGLFQ